MITQVIADTIVRAAEIGLLALGVTMIFAVLRFAHFAHGEMALIGAYAALALIKAGLPLVLACIAGVCIAGAVAVLCDRLLIRKIRKSPGLVLLIASIGLSIFLRHIVATIWGVDALSFPSPSVGTHDIFGAFVTTLQIWIVVTALVAMFGFHAFLYRTRFGKALRALSDNSDLAQARGINVERVVPILWFVVGAYAGLGGILIGLETILTPEMGYNIMLAVFSAAILGGIGSIYGAVLGAVIIAFAENVLVAFDWSGPVSLFGLLPIDGPLYVPTGYKVAVSFVILVLVLIFMPRGIMKGSTGD
jgi:branched-subunit amino acid ABC-type transport system permease component